MAHALTLSLSSEILASGAAEERATFGMLAITANGRLLTAGQDTGNEELRHGPYVAGHPLAEWLAWNRWRLRWEPPGRPSDEDAESRWDFAHRMATVGDGYAWPDVTIFSDGIEASLDSGPSRDPDTVLFRYLGAPERQTIPAAALEAAVDGFLEDVVARLEGDGLRTTNLHRLRNDLEAEWNDPELARFRRLEAQLGCDPDEADEDAIRRHLDDAASLGVEALGEVASAAALQGRGPDGMMSARGIEDIARRSGFDANANDSAALTDDMDVLLPEEVPAWRLGTHAARTLRDREDLDGRPISDERLADFAGTTSRAIVQTDRRSDGIAFALRPQGGDTRIALRSGRWTGRRFELARLIGDRALGLRMDYADEPLLPATRARSYRQKMQHAFAAELLSPFDAVDDMLNGDYSEERQTELAKHFRVSSMTIGTQLVNRRRIDPRDAPDIAALGSDRV